MNRICQWLLRLQVKLMLLVCWQAYAGDVVLIKWPSKFAPEPAKLSPALSQWLPTFQLALDTLPEPAIVQLALTQPQLLGIDANQANKLRSLVAERYRLIASAPDFRNAPSVLRYSYPSQKADCGYATAYIPERINSATKTLIFVHGYGGSFVWYLHWLASYFPDQVILAPSYGLSPAYISPIYLKECVEALEKRLGRPASSKTLIGLSAGGFGACHLVVEAPDQWNEAICLGCYPPPECLAKAARGQRFHFICGRDEYYVKSNKLSGDTRTLKSRGADATMELLPSEDHFFMLTSPDQTAKALRMALDLTR